MGTFIHRKMKTKWRKHLEKGPPEAFGLSTKYYTFTLQQ